MLYGVGACVACGRVLDHTGWTTITATISISIRTNITITMTLTITLFNNIAYLMVGLAGVIWGWRWRGVISICRTHSKRIWAKLPPERAPPERVNRRRVIPREPFGPYRAGAGLFSTGFFRRGLGWRAVGADTAEFDGPPQRLVPKPRAVRGSAFYTEPQYPPSPGMSWKLPGPCGRARGQYWPGWGCHPLPRRGGFPPDGFPPDGFMGGPLTPRPMGVTVPTVVPPGFEPRTAGLLESPP